jgi:large subunit ribosomal protein L25
MAEQITLRAELGRPTGSRASRRIRDTGGVPGVVYGKGRDPLNVTVDHHDLMVIISHHGVNALIALDTGSEKILTLPKTVERHPYRNRIRHVDFIGVNLKEKVTTHVGVVVVGEAIGVKDGGVLNQITHTLTVESLPSNIPAHIEVDVTDLAMGGHIRAEDLASNRDFTILDDPDTMIVLVAAPAGEAVAEEAEEEAEGEAAVESQAAEDDAAE